MDGGVQAMPRYTPKELRDLLEISKRVGRPTGMVLRAWNGGTASIHLLMGEKESLGPTAGDDHTQ